MNKYARKDEENLYLKGVKMGHNHGDFQGGEPFIVIKQEYLFGRECPVS